MKIRAIDVELMQSLLEYRPDVGGSCLVWKIDRCSGRNNRVVKKRAGDVAGHMAADGYVYVGINGTAYKAHRLVWAIVKGEDPSYPIDHIEGKHNQITNLRLTPNGQRDNMQNRKRNAGNQSGFVGVSKASKGLGWVARIGANKSVKYLGTYPTAEEAYAAYIKAKKQLHTFEPGVREV